MYKLAVLAVCLFFASTALTGAARHGRKSAESSKKTSSKTSPAAKHSKAGAAPKSARSRGSVGSKTRTKTARAAKGSAKGKNSRTSRKRGKSTRTTASSRSSAQRVPTADRYREIQQALADRGYYKGPVNGEWGTESAESLKRFQREQNLSPTGKLDSLSLISLGLGPRRDQSAHAGPATSTSNSSSPTTSPKEPVQP